MLTLAIAIASFINLFHSSETQKDKLEQVSKKKEDNRFRTLCIKYSYTTGNKMSTAKQQHTIQQKHILEVWERK